MYITKKQASKIMGVSIRTLDRDIKRNLIKTRYFNSRIRIPLMDLIARIEFDRYLDELSDKQYDELLLHTSTYQCLIKEKGL
jgi:hypothetical protein